MSRYLFVVPPLVGHINPTLAVGQELTARGHSVAWAGHEQALAALLAPEARVFGAHDDALDGMLAGIRSRWQEVQGIAALKLFWEDFVVPLGRVMLAGVERAVAEFGPDVVVADQQAIAGPVVARRQGLPWATSATTSAELTRPLRTMPKVEDWVVAIQAAFQRAAGIADPVDLRFSELLVLCFTTRALIGSDEPFPGHYVFTGPAIGGRPPAGEFPWDRLDPDRRRVLVSLGSVNAEAGRRFFRVVVDALADEVQLVMVAPPGMVEEPPAGAIVAEWVPQLELLPHMDAVVNHAGHNTVVEALAFGLPQVVAPIRGDQPVVASQVEASGAGIGVRFSRVREAELRDAVRATLDDPSYRQAAERIRRTFEVAGGASAAADHLEEVVGVIAGADIARRPDIETDLRLAAAGFEAVYGRLPAVVVSSPGSLTLFGGGGERFAFVVPVRWGAWVAVDARPDDLVELRSNTRLGDGVEVRLDSLAGAPAWAAPALAPLEGLEHGFSMFVGTALPDGCGVPTAPAVATAVAEAVGAMLGRMPSVAEWPAIGDVAGQLAVARCPDRSAMLVDEWERTAETLPFDLAASGLRLLIVDTGPTAASSVGAAVASGDAAEGVAAEIRRGNVRAVGAWLDQAQAGATDAVVQMAVVARGAGALGAGLVAGGGLVMLVPEGGLGEVRAALIAAWPGERRPRFLIATADRDGRDLIGAGGPR